MDLSNLAQGLLPWLQSAQHSLPWHVIVPTAAASYLALVQSLRFRALHKIERKYAAYLADPYKLSYKQAQDIMQLSMLNDTPFLFAFGTQWALIKSYGVASGTPLLVKTRQLSDPTKAGKRAEDTAVMLVEFIAGDLDSERGRLAMAKLNWMHHRFSIAEEDYVHTLSLFVLEPHRWIEKYDWRPLTKLEKVAHFLYWREIGHRMGFGGIPKTLEELVVWKAEFEKTHLYYIPENRMVTDATVDVFLRGTPKFLHGFVRAMFCSFIDEEIVRKAIGYPDPQPWAVALKDGFLGVRKFYLRHLALPRFSARDPLPKQGPDGRYYRAAQSVAFEPWYVADTWLNRISLWLKHGSSKLPSDKWRKDGYLPHEIGPAGTEKVSREPVALQAAALEEYVASGQSAMGCPFDFGWKR
ncbi:oxygenase MpaB family protein [Microdochium nivale]|nr:oxygenase MpaB family protein [Microdochium nivale]